MKSILELSISELNTKLQSGQFELELLNYQFYNFKHTLNLIKDNTEISNLILNFSKKNSNLKLELTNSDQFIKEFCEDLYKNPLSQSIAYNLSAKLKNNQRDLIIYKLINSREEYYCFVDMTKQYKNKQCLQDEFKKLTMYFSMIAAYFTEKDEYYLNYLLFTKCNETFIQINTEQSLFSHDISGDIHIGIRDYYQFDRYYSHLDLIKEENTNLYLIRFKINEHYDQMLNCVLNGDYKIKQFNQFSNNTFISDFIKSNNKLVINSLPMFDFSTLNIKLPNIKLNYNNYAINDSRLIKQMALVGDNSYVRLIEYCDNHQLNADYTIDEESMLYQGDKRRIRCISFSKINAEVKMTLAATYEDMLDFIESGDIHKLYDDSYNVKVRLVYQGSFVYLTLEISADMFNQDKISQSLNDKKINYFFKCEPSESYNKFNIVFNNGIYNSNHFKNIFSVLNTDANIIDDIEQYYRFLLDAKNNAINCRNKFKLMDTESKLNNEHFIQLLEKIE